MVNVCVKQLVHFVPGLSAGFDPFFCFFHRVNLKPESRNYFSKTCTAFIFLISSCSEKTVRLSEKSPNIAPGLDLFVFTWSSVKHRRLHLLHN